MNKMILIVRAVMNVTIELLMQMITITQVTLMMIALMIKYLTTVKFKIMQSSIKPSQKLKSHLKNVSNSKIGLVKFKD